MSENFVQTGPTAVVAITYAAPIQEYPAAELRSAQIVGIAVATMVVFKAEMNVADWYRELVPRLLYGLVRGQAMHVLDEWINTMLVPEWVAYKKSCHN